MTTDNDGAIPKDSPKPSTEDKHVISETQLGIWRVFTATDRRGALGLWLEFWETYPLIIQLIVDVYKVCPRLLYLSLLSECWNGLQLALEMRLENILLAQIELAISTGKGNLHTIVFVIGCKILHSVIGSYVRWSDGHVMPALNRHLRQHFHIKIMNANLMADLPTSAETPERRIKENAALSSLRTILGLLRLSFEISSQIMLLLEVSRMNGANVLLMVSLLQVMMTRFSPTAFWSLPLFAYVDNDDYKRAQSLNRFADGSFRQDIISSNLGNWIIAEYRKAFAAVGDTSTDHLHTQYYYRTKANLVGIAREILGGFPSVYFALMVAIDPRHLSIASIATLQSSGRSLVSSVGMLFDEFEDIREGLDLLRRLYTPKISNIMKDGTLCLTEKEKGDTIGSKGMSLILKDVSFAYPGGGKKTNALKGINLDIKAGQLVIIVGANGSGKSTLTRILARLYDPSSGELLIEGRPSTEYRIEELHLATSFLSQDSQMYPLSLAENIGLGYPECSSDLEMIKEAANDGGAAEFIEGLENGYETILEPFEYSFHMNLNGDRGHPLWKMSDKRAKKSDVSGGQRQRVIAARTFMRFKSGKVKLVLVDEPTSALDADGELQLFQRLMSAREGKTMVFVTHRFGHLTKFADQIICMKGGAIVESGNHRDLVSAAGEYANLYKIQAQAFSGDSDLLVSSTEQIC